MKSKKIIIKSLFFDQKIQRIKLFIFLKFLEKKKENFYMIVKYYHFIDQEQSKKKVRRGSMV